ncbi:MAG: FAD-binding oxidoreductase [Candidatus Dormibacteraeota bacterium]|nr:FAD-binding oxidoreductase [Candidatus Dormibacteraeota bacterium]
MERDPARDLWPLGLMRARAGASALAADIRRPTTHKEVVEALRSGRRVVPRGGGSGVCGAVDPEPGDLVLDLGGLDHLDIDAPNLLVRAGAGVNGQALERSLNAVGLTLGHFPSSLPVATLGGLVSTRSSGQESTRFGGVEDMVAGLTVALPGGRVVETRTPARSAGPAALHQLFCGAEGALGVILEAVLRVHRLPEAMVGTGWRLADVDAGLRAMREVMQRGLRPLVMRLYDPSDSAFQGEFDGCLLVAACAGRRRVAEAEAAELAEVVEAEGGSALGPEPWERWLRHRFDLSAERLVAMLEGPGAYLDTIELGSTWQVLPRLYADVRDHLERMADVVLCHFSHLTEQGGCAYFSFAGSAPDEPAAEARYRAAWEGTMEAGLAHGAALSHHHGVGQARAPWVRRDLGDWWPVWEAVRATIDPERRLNPNGVGGEGGPRP